MTKHKAKRAKVEKQREWEDELGNPGSVSTGAEESGFAVASQSPIRNIFTAEIKAMLYAYGDVRHPLFETAALVEEIVHSQICELLKMVANVAMKRMCPEIGLEEFVFLLRKDTSKLSRFVQRMNLLHHHTKMSTASLSGVKLEPTYSDEEACGLSLNKRRKICMDFLTQIDETGELVDAATRQDTDASKMKRIERAERQTRDMDPTEYMEFARCRQISFAAHKGARTRFREWFDFDALQIEARPSQFGWDALEYLAQETVADLVDLALIVQSEMVSPLLPCETEPDARHLPLFASATFAARTEILGVSSCEDESSDSSREASVTKRKAGDGSLNRKLALKPSHVSEAMRRFNHCRMKDFLSKTIPTSQTMPMKLICLP